MGIGHPGVHTISSSDGALARGIWGCAVNKRECYLFCGGQEGEGVGFWEVGDRKTEFSTAYARTKAPRDTPGENRQNLLGETCLRPKPTGRGLRRLVGLLMSGYVHSLVFSLLLK